MSLKRRFPAIYLTLTILFLAASHIPTQAQSIAPPTDGWCSKLDVSTRNMYLGTDFSEIFAAQDAPTLFTEVAEAFADVQASNVQARIQSIAHEIKTSKPDLVGLQEVALWQTGPFDPGAPSANTVAYDYLQLLLDELNKNGSLKYEPVSVLTNLVAEVPAVGPTGLFDVRFTDRVVLLVRTDLRDQNFSVQNVVAQHFATILSLPTPTLGVITIPRGYISADVGRCGQTVRVVTTHLESFEEQIGLPFPIFRFAQATELLQGPGATTMPVVFAGDFNADAENPLDPTYQLLLSGNFLDAWEETSPNNPGFTWPLFLETPFLYTAPTQRLDLVLSRGSIEATSAYLTGEKQVSHKLPMPSDHAGVTATFRLQQGPVRWLAHELRFQPMSKILLGLIWITLGSAPALAQETNNAQQIAEVKAAVAKIGNGAKVQVTRRGKPKVKGEIREFRDEDFEVISSENGSIGVAVHIPYSEVLKIKGKGVNWQDGSIKAGGVGLKVFKVMGTILKGAGCIGPISGCSP
ncbi:MAG TPA: endonuclease/exonuclease/phosphatase family protein [Pyrinomonadaceae bacterium]|nr:endonuclease/exonuclease/phosphatase family protein [Pyrinomonadaceae bacterium]